MCACVDFVVMFLTVLYVMDGWAWSCWRWCEFEDCLRRCVQICERSLTGGQSGPTMPPVQSFVRGEMFPSGYLIRPCEGGGCIIHVVDHYDNEVMSCGGSGLWCVITIGGGVWIARDVSECSWMVCGVVGSEEGVACVGGRMCSLGACRTYCGLCMNRRRCWPRSARWRHYGMFGG
jgi:hypothetical protein